MLHLTVCKTGAGVQWSHLGGGGRKEKKEKEILHVRNRDGAQLDVTDG